MIPVLPCDKTFAVAIVQSPALKPQGKRKKTPQPQQIRCSGFFRQKLALKELVVREGDGELQELNDPGEMRALWQYGLSVFRTGWALSQWPRIQENLLRSSAFLWHR